MIYVHTLCGAETLAGEEIDKEIASGVVWCSGCQTSRPTGEMRWKKDGTQVR